MNQENVSIWDGVVEYCRDNGPQQLLNLVPLVLEFVQWDYRRPAFLGN